MQNLNKHITILRDELQTVRNDIKNSRSFVKMPAEQFGEVLTLNAEIILSKRNQKTKFIIDDDNSGLIRELYFYLVGSENFCGDLYKGIFISGNIGTGKTLIMNSFLKIIDDLSRKNVTKLHSKAIASYLKDNEDGYLNKRPLFIDDIGKETKIVNDYGTIKNTIPDLFALRYDYGAWTFATCNYSSDDLTEFYGETIFDRFKEMFNYFTLTGNSRRK
jgi:DNA replication protein DnaC